MRASTLLCRSGLPMRCIRQRVNRLADRHPGDRRSVAAGDPRVLRSLDRAPLRMVRRTSFFSASAWCLRWTPRSLAMPRSSLGAWCSPHIPPQSSWRRGGSQRRPSRRRAKTDVPALRRLGGDARDYALARRVYLTIGQSTQWASALLQRSHRKNRVMYPCPSPRPATHASCTSSCRDDDWRQDGQIVGTMIGGNREPGPMSF